MSYLATGLPKKSSHEISKILTYEFSTISNNELKKIKRDLSDSYNNSYENPLNSSSKETFSRCALKHLMVVIVLITDTMEKTQK